MVADNGSDKYTDKNRVKEYPVDLMKISGVINTSSGRCFKIRFTNDGNASVHTWLKRFVLEYVMLY
jgi:hypothetical protein